MSPESAGAGRSMVSGSPWPARSTIAGPTGSGRVAIGVCSLSSGGGGDSAVVASVVAAGSSPSAAVSTVPPEPEQAAATRSTDKEPAHRQHTRPVIFARPGHRPRIVTEIPPKGPTLAPRVAMRQGSLTQLPLVPAHRAPPESRAPSSSRHATVTHRREWRPARSGCRVFHPAAPTSRRLSSSGEVSWPVRGTTGTARPPRPG